MTWTVTCPARTFTYPHNIPLWRSFTTGENSLMKSLCVLGYLGLAFAALLLPGCNARFRQAPPRVCHQQPL